MITYSCTYNCEEIFDFSDLLKRNACEGSLIRVFVWSGSDTLLSSSISESGTSNDEILKLLCEHLSSSWAHCENRKTIFRILAWNFIKAYIRPERGLTCGDDTAYDLWGLGRHCSRLLGHVDACDNKLQCPHWFKVCFRKYRAAIVDDLRSANKYFDGWRGLHASKC